MSRLVLVGGKRASAENSVGGSLSLCLDNTTPQSPASSEATRIQGRKNEDLTAGLTFYGGRNR